MLFHWTLSLASDQRMHHVRFTEIPNLLAAVSLPKESLLLHLFSKQEILEEIKVLK